MLEQVSQIDLELPEVKQLCRRFAEKFNLPLSLAHILCDRGYSTEKEVETFLYPSFAELPQPDMMRGVQETVNIVFEAWQKNKAIIIHGDYDVDGVTATALMVTFFKSLGLSPLYYIPNRLTDSYGFTQTSVHNILKLLNGKQGLVLTVDCGISSVEAVAYAKTKGLEVIITDHHQPPAELPRAEAIVNPKQPGCDFPFKHLSGVGVAFFVIAAIRRAFINHGYWSNEADAPKLKYFLDLVALGTIADVMPLVGVNRILVRAGLDILNQKQRVGIYALCEQCGMYQNDVVRSEEISFKLAPRINAAGRMGQAEHAVRLLLAEDYNAAKTQAKLLEGLNKERRALENAVLEEIYTECETLIEEGYNGLVVFHKSCHPGVLGIIAARIVERFDRPAIVVTEEQADAQDTFHLKGSGRSVEEVNIYEKLDLCSEHLKQFGGHPMAVGVTLETSSFDRFRSAFSNACATEQAGAIASHQTRSYDMTPKDLDSRGFITKLQWFQPFGEGNPEPLFSLEGVRLHNVKDVSGHLKFSLVVQNTKPINGIGFNLADQMAHVKENPVDILFKFKRSSYRGVKRNEIQLISIS